MKYETSTAGPWLTVDDSLDGMEVKLTSECIKVDSRFLKEDGTPKTENQVKAQFAGSVPVGKDGEKVTGQPVNMRLNWTTVYGLIEAFGNDSEGWIGKPLTAKVKDATTGQSIYLIPEGSELYRNEEKRWAIRKVGGVDAAPEEEDEPVIE